MTSGPMPKSDPRVISAFRRQAEKCRELGSPFTAGLLDGATSSLEAGGPLADLIGGWPGDPVEDALPLRLAGALHALVLEGAAPELAETYPRPGEPGRAKAAWRTAEAVIGADPEAFRPRLDSPPQTNETGRAIGLFPGLLVTVERFGLPLDLYELGASAGLLLNMAEFAYRTDGWTYGGEAAVVIQGGWRGPPPPMPGHQVEGRRGCDANPLDPSKPEHRNRLRAYVWADQFERMRRLEAALDLAAARGASVERADAGQWLEARLAERRPGVVSVIYHSVFWQYAPAETQARMRAAIERAGARADEGAPLAWLQFEPDPRAGGPGDSRRYGLVLTLWPGGEPRVLAEVDPHGRWVDWRG